MLREDDPLDGDTSQNPITWVQAYDPVYWRLRAERARKKAFDASGYEAAAFKREAADCERLAAFAAGIGAE